MSDLEARLAALEHRVGEARGRQCHSPPALGLWLLHRLQSRRGCGAAVCRRMARWCSCRASTTATQACGVSMALGSRTSLPGASMGPCTASCSITSRCRTSSRSHPTGRTAKGRFRGLLMGGSHESRDYKPEGLPLQFLEAGIYENDYVREDGVWKIKRLDYMMQWQADYEQGWSRTVAHLQPASQTYPGKSARARRAAAGRPGAQDLAASPGRADALCASALWCSSGGKSVTQNGALAP